MIPILYRPDEIFFLSNGLGRLTECTSCVVTEERNGIYECEFKYPITGRFYNTLIDRGGIITVIHDDKHDIQPFDIYSFSAPIDGIVTFWAHHISYRLANIIVSPYTAESCAIAVDGLKTYSLNENKFTFWTDKATSGTFTVKHPDNIRALLGGQEGSILDVYGTGEYEFDKYQVKLHLNRGVNTGVTIRYGKNMTDIERQFDESQTYNAVAPYWQDTEGNVVTLSDYIVVSPDAPMTLSPWTASSGDYITDNNGEIIYFQTINIVPIQLDLSSDFQEAPTEEELRQRALDYLSNNQPWVPHDNIKVDFVQLWQSPEYEDVASLQRVSLCDRVSIYYPELGVTAANAEVIRVVYNVLTERYDSMEIGTPRTTLSEYLRGDILAELLATPEFSGWQAAIVHATEMITGGLGGHVVMNLNANGEPQEILIMDTDDKETAVHVIRMNRNGIGFSNNGYSGPFESAWTIDGQFNANFIATGSLLANFIKGGTLLLGGLSDSNGVLQVNDINGKTVVAITNEGIKVYDTSVAWTSIVTTLNEDGLSMYKGKIEIFDNGGSVNLWPGAGLSVSQTATDSQFSVIDGFLTLRRDDDQFNVSVAQPEYVPGAETTYISLSKSNGSVYTNIEVERIQSFNTSYPTGEWKGFEVSRTEIFTQGNISCSGTKSRITDLDQFGRRFLYCYETPSPMFGDVGEGVIDETGLCYVFLDPVFAETIATTQYQVFLQRYGQGDCFVSERKPDHFIVQGEPGLSFAWELKAKQKGFDQMRLEKQQEALETGINYGDEGQTYYINLTGRRIES